jgi:hypothetical protein
MKQILIVMLAAGAAFGEEAKEHKLTELEREKLLRIQSQAQLIQERYQRELAPLTAEQQQVLQPACVELGIPLDRMAECAVDVAPANGAAFGRVWWAKPAAAQVSQPERKK